MTHAVPAESHETERSAAAITEPPQARRGPTRPLLACGVLASLLGGCSEPSTGISADIPSISTQAGIIVPENPSEAQDSNTEQVRLGFLEIITILNTLNGHTDTENQDRLNASIPAALQSINTHMQGIFANTNPDAFGSINDDEAGLSVIDATVSPQRSYILQKRVVLEEGPYSNLAYFQESIRTSVPNSESCSITYTKITGTEGLDSEFDITSEVLWLGFSLPDGTRLIIVMEYASIPDVYSSIIVRTGDGEDVPTDQYAKILEQTLPLVTNTLESVNNSTPQEDPTSIPPELLWPPGSLVENMIQDNNLFVIDQDEQTRP